MTRSTRLCGQAGPGTLNGFATEARCFATTDKRVGGSALDGAPAFALEQVRAAFAATAPPRPPAGLGGSWEQRGCRERHHPADELERLLAGDTSAQRSYQAIEASLVYWSPPKMIWSRPRTVLTAGRDIWSNGYVAGPELESATVLTVGCRAGSYIDAAVRGARCPFRAAILP
jgi:hypothetical protein